MDERMEMEIIRAEEHAVKMAKLAFGLEKSPINLNLTGISGSHTHSFNTNQISMQAQARMQSQMMKDAMVQAGNLLGSALPAGDQVRIGRRP